MRQTDRPDPPSPPPPVISPFESDLKKTGRPSDAASSAAGSGDGWLAECRRLRLLNGPWWGILLLAAAVGWLFRDVLLREGLLTFRDSLHFYYPLFERIQQEWEAGRVPLWNPYSNAGEPLLASPTSSVFYPFKALFFLPISYWARYHLYIIVHVLLAGWNCGWAARRWGASWPAATLAGLAYACGGNVLFNYSNVVFLCGAAWLPIAFVCGEAAIEQRSVRSASLLASSLALMVLGGDPQLAYEAGLLVALYAVIVHIHEHSAETPARSGSGPPAFNSRFGVLTNHRLVLLGFAAALSGLLAAVQILPSQEAGRSSVRSAREVPSSVWEVPGYFFGGRKTVPRPDTKEPPHWYDALVGDPPPPAKHPLQVYGNSFPLWRVIEFFLPNITGRLFPDDTRWGFLLGWEEFVWIPSQYLGLWPMLLALGAFRLRRTDARTCWLSLIVLISFLAAWGYFGPNWLLTQVGLTGGAEVERIPIRMRGGVGGVYWLLTVLLPGFAEFRYPSKLLVLTAAGLSLLSARGLDRLFGTGDRGGVPLGEPVRDEETVQALTHEEPACPRLTRVMGGLAAVSLIGLAVLGLWGNSLENYFEQVRVSRNMAFDAARSVRELRGALLHTACVAGLGAAGLGGLGRCLRSGRRNTSTKLDLAWLVVIGTALDIGIANSALIHTTDRRAWEAKPALVHHVEQAEAERGAESPRPVRIARANDWEGPSPTPQSFGWDDRVAWQRQSLIVRQNLPYGIGIIFSLGSLDNMEFESWFDVLPISQRPEFLAPRRSYDTWGTRYFVVDQFQHANDQLQSSLGLRTSWAAPGSTESSPVLPLGEKLPPARKGVPNAFDGVDVLFNDAAFPPAWIVHRIVPFEPIAPRDRTRWLPLMFEMVFPQRNAIDLRTAAVIEDDALAARQKGKSQSWPIPQGSAETCRIVSYASDRVDLEATLFAEGVLVLSDSYAPGWRAEVSTDGGSYRPQPVLRTNRTMRGLHLSAGTHQIRYVYRPASFYVGGTLSLLSWIGLGLAFFWRRRQGHP